MIIHATRVNMAHTDEANDIVSVKYALQVCEAFTFLMENIYVQCPLGVAVGLLSI